MHKLKYHGIKLPDIYVVEKSEAQDARDKGVPFVVRPKSWTDEDIIKRILYYWICEKFPWIDIKMDKPRVCLKIEVPAEYREDYGDGLGGYDSDTPEYMQFSEDGEYRESGGGVEESIDLFQYKEVKFDEFFDPKELSVDIEVLQKLKMLPVFLDDISNAIKQNLMNVSWMDGWNKKLGMPTGNFQGGTQAPNLIILDVSGSIPNGVASCMVSLIETLRTQADADLIVTSGSSHWYPKTGPCPTPEQLSYLVGGGNETQQFYKILNDHVLGKHWGNVIVFGDQDCPAGDSEHESVSSWAKNNIRLLDAKALAATRVDNLMGFHTYSSVKMPGYGRWALRTQLGTQSVTCDWVRSMKLPKRDRDRLERWQRNRW